MPVGSLDELVGVIMEFRRPDGSLLRRSLSGDEARKWDNQVFNVCSLAHIHGCNPDWTKLKWEEKVIKSKKKRRKVWREGISQNARDKKPRSRK